ncbi:NAD-dependent epimerase/dehydratase family protein [Paenibacillus riograndensis]|uniref:Nucleoside-diphosphate-sugar epimerase n=1 Tax=Paenibacillus riograndensis SBR5 TaxID=1073571 RepID=A0A0E4H942_9BACL|nr:NAD-dependent epimerase/dehydratase family protein [Paenibacillus riograndensis]CQR54844.1 nucleoside-diphosphate-sugar epimerase [Paenibacillus riograndensis SBR5]
MRNILVLGGTRFFGKRLVERLFQDADTQVTILTRGITKDGFGSRVNRLNVDRTDAKALAEAVRDTVWDVVYDNICFSPDEAAAASRIFAETAKRYILTSSLSVYDPGPGILREADFDPLSFPLRLGAKEDFNYQEGKRLAETVLLTQAAFPAAAVRFPIVLGTDDYTKRLHFHIEHVLEGKAIGVPNPGALISFIRSDEAADFLYGLGFSQLAGPVNACSDGTLAIGDILNIIGQKTGREAVVLSETADQDMSPFGIEESWYMDTAKARGAGFQFLKLAEWFPELIGELATELNASLRKRE